MTVIALLSIGIDYAGQLQGCVRDSNNIKQYFSARQPLAAVWQMIDSLPISDPLYPSRSNIERQLRYVAQNATRFTHVIVHYSGHGSQSRDRNYDEQDGLDEVLVPADYATAAFITDDWLLRNFVLKMPASVNVLCIFDACHSGTMLDLKYNWLPARRGGYARVVNNSRCSEMPNVTLLSGCLDKQYSYETNDATYGLSGALTSAFLNSLRTRLSRDPAIVLYYIQQAMNNRLQTAQISSTKKTIPSWNYIL